MRKRFVFFILVFFVALVLTSCKEDKISFTDSVINLKVGESKKINFEVTKGREVEFSLPNETIAKISGDNIVGVSVGEVELKATIKGTEISAKATVKVTKVEPSGVSIAGASSGLVGSKIQLTATVSPDNTTDKAVVWSSSNVAVAVVDQAGKVSLLRVGEATIKAQVGTKEATHVVTVNPVLAESVTISGASSGLVGAEIRLTAAVLPENTTDKTVVWSSSDEEIATVNQIGKVSLLKVGEVVIKAQVGSLEATHEITVNPILVDSVIIQGDAIGLVGAQIQLTAVVLPENAADKTVTWSSSDTTVASVDQSGKVNLLKVGVVTIKAQAGTKEATHVITVNPVLAESVTISGDTTGPVGGEIQLTATVLPANTADKTVMWSSSNQTIAKVDQTGKVSLLKAGEVTITAVCGSKEATHVITVNVVLAESVVVEGEATGLAGEEIQLTATILPENTTDKTVRWSSSNEALATVDASGKVTLLAAGTVTITAKVGLKEGTREIVITEPVAKIGSAVYATLQKAVNAAVDNDVIVVLKSVDEAITIAKSNLTLKALNNTVIYSGAITIDATEARTNITIDGFKLTGGFKLRAAGKLDGFTFKNNEVYDTTTEASSFSPYVRTNVNAIIQIYSGSGTNVNGNLTVINNTFRNIPSDVISYDRLSTDKTIRIEDNVVENFGRSFFRLDGGWNNGNIIIDNNLLKNDADKVSRGGITFRCFGANSGTNLVLHITNNSFENVGLNIPNNGRNPESGAITVGVNNGSAIDFKVTGNMFKNTANALHLNTVGEATITTITNNVFINNRGYAIFNTTTLPEYNQNTFMYDEATVVLPEHLSKYTYDTGEEKLTVIYPITGVNILGDVHGLIGAEIQLEAELIPEDTNADKTVTWASNNETLATVDANGLVTLLTKGTVEISATAGGITVVHEIVIDVPVTGLAIIGPNAGIIGDEVTLDVEILPLEAAYRKDKVIWSVDVDALATVTNAGVVTLLRKGTVIVSATIDGVVADFELFINDEPAAKIGTVGYGTIQTAIDAAVAGDVINVNYGTFDEALIINKAVTLRGFAGQKSILTNKITIGNGVNGVTIDGFKMTGKAQIYNAGVLEDFSFINNFVYDTDLAASAYSPNARTNVNAIIQIYSGGGMNKVGGITIEHNVFNNIKSDIIAMDRTKVGMEINIRHNEFRNFGVGAIRFDGGYNNGTYNITNNIFENDMKQAEAAIVFRAYSSSSGNIQTINITDNVFKNIGNETRNRNGVYPGSAVISTSTYNENQIAFSITNNQFVNTHNSIHLRKNSSKGADIYTVTVTGNTFENPSGYVYFEDGKIATYELNTYLDRLGVEVVAERVILTDDPAYRQYNIAEPVLESFAISGAATGSVTDEVLLELVAVPPYYEFGEVTWTSSDELLATVANGVVSLLAEGDVVITAKIGDLTATHNINITAKVAAKILDVEYATIQAAIDAAEANDVITILPGTYNEVLTVNKSNISFTGVVGEKSVLTNVINIGANLENISFMNLSFTGDAQIKKLTGTLKGFTFKNNHVYNTNLAASTYVPTTRTNVNAFIQTYTLSGENIHGNFYIEDNIFENIKSDIISIDRSMHEAVLDIKNNVFRNFGVSAIRFDGGWNNGTYNITGNTFENDVLGASSAITFRCFGTKVGQTINIDNNTFTNIGDVTFNKTGNQPGSGVITTGYNNGGDVTISVSGNTFTNTFNSIHLRTSGADLTGSVKNNTFKVPRGYLYYENANLAVYELNTYLDENDNPINEANIEHISTANRTEVNYVAEYMIVYHTFNPETEVYDITYEIIKDTVGKTIKFIIPALEGYYVNEPILEGVVVADNSLRLDVYYHLIVINPDAFPYQLVLNGGNFDYETRRALVDDFINDYNAVNSKSYTLETLGMNIWGDVDYHNVFYHELYRDKWLWLADYLGQVGSSANRRSAQDILTYETAAEWNARSSNWKYALSYEVRAFLKGIHWTANANWPTADYSDIERANGFWPLYATYKISLDYMSEGAEEILPIPYMEGYNFVGWYLSEDLTGEPITILTETAKLYAKYEEKTPVTALEITNPVTELLKNTTHQLEITITPADAFNKTLVYYSSDLRVATVSDTGLITALNEGTVTIKVTNYNGLVETTMTFTVYPGDDIKISFNEEYTGNLQVNDEFTMDVEGVGKGNAGAEYTYQVLDEAVLEFTTPNKFKALKTGETTIDIYKGSTLVKSYKVVVQGAFNDADRVDQLLEILAAGNNPIAQGLNVILVHQSTNEYSQPKHESVNAYLFDDFVVDRTTYLADPNGRTSGIKTSTEFVLVHDTANINGGLTAHGSFFKTATNVSIHYVVGDGGIIQSIEDKYVAWHAGDGTSVPFAWLETGVTVTDPNAKPEFDISTDGYFMINGTKTTILAPTDSGRILDKSYFTYIGPTWRIVGNKYELGTHYFTRSQQSYGVIASRGGNNNSIGIEMCVNTTGDSIDTLQRTAKLVANLLEQYNLPNSRVIMHNTTDGKADPYMINNTSYNGSWYFPRFMEHVEIEREILKNFSDATIQFSSDSPLVSNTGRVITMPDETTVVEYTVTVTIGEVTKSIKLVSVIPGKHTWSQNYGNFKPLVRWAKSDYRIDQRFIVK